MIIKENENILVKRLEIKIEDTEHTTNVYILKDKHTNKAMVIDPAFDCEYILDELKEMDLESVIITHSHADHIAALSDLVNGTNIKVYIHKFDYEGLYDGVLNEQDAVNTKVYPVDKRNVNIIEDNEIVKIGNTKLTLIHTPGHTKGSIVVLDKEDNILFSGDTIFKNTYGRTDLITGSREDMGVTLNKLFDKFDEIDVYPGHDDIFNLKDAKRRIRLLFAYKG